MANETKKIVDLEATTAIADSDLIIVQPVDGETKKMTYNALTGELKTNLGVPFKFGVDEQGNYGYVKEGADTVTPFLKTIQTASYSGTYVNPGLNNIRGILLDDIYNSLVIVLSTSNVNLCKYYNGQLSTIELNEVDDNFYNTINSNQLESVKDIIRMFPADMVRYALVAEENGRLLGVVDDNNILEPLTTIMIFNYSGRMVTL